MLAIRSVSAQLLHFTLYNSATCLALAVENATGIARIRLSNSIIVVPCRVKIFCLPDWWKLGITVRSTVSTEPAPLLPGCSLAADICLLMVASDGRPRHHALS